jgi:hypothetical protein
VAAEETESESESESESKGKGTTPTQKKKSREKMNKVEVKTNKGKGKARATVVVDKEVGRERKSKTEARDEDEIETDEATFAGLDVASAKTPVVVVEQASRKVGQQHDGRRSTVADKMRKLSLKVSSIREAIPRWEGEGAQGEEARKDMTSGQRHTAVQQREQNQAIAISDDNESESDDDESDESDLYAYPPTRPAHTLQVKSKAHKDMPDQRGCAAVPQKKRQDVEATSKQIAGPARSGAINTTPQALGTAFSGQ